MTEINRNHPADDKKKNENAENLLPDCEQSCSPEFSEGCIGCDRYNNPKTAE